MALSGAILTGVVLLQKSLGDIAGDEAELSVIDKTSSEKGSQKKSFLKKRRDK